MTDKFNWNMFIIKEMYLSHYMHETKVYLILHAVFLISFCLKVHAIFVLLQDHWTCASHDKNPFGLLCFVHCTFSPELLKITVVLQMFLTLLNTKMPGVYKIKYTATDYRRTTHYKEQTMKCFILLKWYLTTGQP